MKNIKTYRESLMESEEKIGLLNARLHWAINDGNLEKAIDALDRGADVNSKAHSLINAERTSLHEAAAHNRTEIMKLLIERGADVDAQDNTGATPLHLAATRQSHDAINILLDAGASIDPTNIAGLTPLNHAKDASSWRTCRLLIERGANPLKAFTGLDEITAFFKGDLDWMPEGPIKTKLKRRIKGKSAFGM